MTPLRVVAVSLVVSCLLCLHSTPVSANVPHAVRSADGSFAVLFGSEGGQGSIKVFKNTSANARGDADGPEFKRTFEVRFDRIDETDASTGNKVQSAAGFATDASLWQGPTPVTVDGVNSQLVSLTNNALMVRTQAHRDTSAHCHTSTHARSLNLHSTSTRVPSRTNPRGEWSLLNLRGIAAAAAHDATAHCRSVTCRSLCLCLCLCWFRSTTK